MAFNITSSPTNAEILATLLGNTTGLSNIQITVSGNPLAVGILQDSSLNLRSGLLLSTGQVSRLQGSNTDDRNNVSTVFNSPGTVANGNDAITLDITFDTDNISRQLFLQYVFGSEEFLDFAGNSFNDKLTLDLNGVDLAKLNNGSPVNVNNLTPSSNPLTFSPDFIPNLSSVNPAYFRTVVDGYTVPLTFQGDLLPNTKNRLVITIQDIGDGAVDSAVFLASGSLGVSSPVPTVEVIVGSPSSVNEDGAGGILYTFTRTGVPDKALSVNYQLEGTATLGTDYTLSNEQTGTINFAPGAVSTTLLVSPRTDDLAENDETVTVKLLPASNAEYVIGTLDNAAGTILDQDTSLNNISLTVLPPRVTEDGFANLIYRFTRTGSTTESLRVDYNVGGTAIYQNDYDVNAVDTSFSFQGSVGSITFNSGVSEVDLVVDPRSDFIIEPPENVVLTLTPSRNDPQLGGRSRSYDIDTTDPVVGNILDSRPQPPFIDLFVQPSIVGENDQTNLSYIFTRTGSIASSLTVSYSVRGTASFDTDYTVLGATSFNSTRGTVTFQAGSNSAVVNIIPTPDAVIEPSETVILQLDNLAGGNGFSSTIRNSSAVVGTIVDATTPIINLTLAPQSVTEGGTARLLYNFSRSGSTNDALTVNYNIGGTATFGADYTQTGASSFNGTSGSIEFAAGSSSATLEITTLTDTIDDSNETIELTLAESKSYEIGNDSFATGTIVEVPTTVPPTVNLTLNRPSVNESNTDNLSYTFTRTGSTDQSLTVRYQITGTAIEDTDYSTLGTSNAGESFRTFSFAPGASTFTVRVDPTPDTLSEGDETVALALLPAGLGYGDTQYLVGTNSSAAGSIVDVLPVVVTPPSVSLTVSPASVNEDSSTNLVYTFTRTGPIDEALRVDYDFGGSAEFGTDYVVIGANSFGSIFSSGATTLNVGTVNFAAGSNTATLVVDPTADSLVETDEDVTLRLAPRRNDSLPGGGQVYNIATPDAIAGIITDTTPVVNLTLEPISISENGQQNLVYLFTRTGLIDQPLTVNYTVSGSASFGIDYNQFGASSFGNTSGSITFAANAAQAVLSISSLPDSLVEQNETISLDLVAAPNYAVGVNSNATGTIVDVPPVIIRTSAGDGELVVSVDEFGGFGSASGVGGNAFYNPLGAVNSSGTTFLSYVALGIIGDSGTTGFRTVLNPSASNNEVFTNVKSTTANSTFVSGGLQFQLNQLVQDTRNTEQSRIGSRLDQTYTITNTTSQTINFELVRYVDGDLDFDNSISDGGGRIVQNGQEILFETDRGGTDQDPTFFGITATGGIIPTTNRFEIDAFSNLDSNILAGNILRNRIIRGDADSDLFIDRGAEYDVTLGLRNTFSLSPGASSIYTTTTRFGSGEPLQLDITPPTGGISDLAATTVGTNINLNWIATDPSGIRGFDLFVSTNGGDYTAFQTGITTNSSVFTGVVGNTYSFYVIATDNAGNSQVATNAPIATTRLVEALRPIINLTVEPISINESSTSGIVYTFTRTGPLDQSLTVNYNVSGSATFGDDYNQTGASSFTNTLGSITFAANSATAALTINPVVDDIVEPTETITLDLVGNPTYTIGSSSSAAGSIVDATPTVSVALEPITVNEDGTQNLIYTFTRTGSTTSSLTVSYSVSGSATFNTDYTQTGATNFSATSGTITFAANSNTATLVIDPTADVIPESDETVELRLITGSGYGNASYIVNTPDNVVGTIINSVVPPTNLPPTAIVFTGNVSNNQFLIAENTSTTSPIKLTDITITDDLLGTNILSISGADVGSFELVGNSLFLRAGVVLDFETKASYDITVSVDDPTVGNSPDVANNFRLIVTDINEPPTSGLNFIGTNNLDVGTINNRTNGIFAVNPNNVNLVGDEINLLAGVDSVTVPGRIITLQPNRPTQAIQIGSADSRSADILDLTPSDLAAIANGFSRIIIGRTNGTGNIDIGSSVTFRDPILLQSPGGTINIAAPVTLTDDATLDFNVKNLVKSGSSTLVINGDNATTAIGNITINGGILLLAKAPNTEAVNNVPIAVNSGILQLGNNEQINNGADLTINGGTLNLNGFNETLDRLQVTSNSTINLGNGSSKLAFGNSSTTNWTGILLIENWSSASGESIRFGNSATGLTAAQLNNIQFVGFGRGANINTSGFITPVGIAVINPLPDQDGVSDDIEDLAPNDGDGNFDGIRDSLQENVVSILNLGGTNVNSIATIIAKAGAKISGLRSLANPISTTNLTSLANPIEFKVTGLANGGATTVEYLIAKADQNRNYNTYLVFGATANNPTPHVYEFLYDGQTGAELFDTNGDGFADKAVVHFVDGLRGDSDLTVNGEIQDPGAPGVATTPVGLSADVNNVVQITGAAGAAIGRFSLVANQTKKVSEVGFFKVDATNRVKGIAANTAGFAQAALQNGQVIFSSLADNLLSSAEISRQLQLNASDRLGFYLVQNGTVDVALQKNDFSNVLFSLDLANPAGKKALEVVAESNGSYRLKWEQGNAEVNDDLTLNLQLQNAPLNNQNLVAGMQGDQESELLDLSSFTGQNVQVNFTIKREAAYNNTVGFYKIEDAQGTVMSITGAKLKPGEAGYQAAVVQNRIAGIDLEVANGQTVSIDKVLQGGAIYAPFLIANGNANSLNGNFSNVYTPYILGNSDTIDHIRLLGDNTFGFEDLVGAGDQDFNDVVLKAVFKNTETSVQTTLLQQLQF